jgi:hypothetical protein
MDINLPSSTKNWSALFASIALVLLGLMSAMVPQLAKRCADIVIDSLLNVGRWLSRGALHRNRSDKPADSQTSESQNVTVESTSTGLGAQTSELTTTATGTKPGSVNVTIRFMGILVVVLAAAAAVALIYVESCPDVGPVSGPVSQKLTTIAWRHYQAKRYHCVVRYANECIDEFLLEAEKIQKELISSEAAAPIAGSPPDIASKEAILKRGPLNDVATCYYMKGRALEKSSKGDEAASAYDHARRLSYARAWDPDAEIFWSPAEAAEGRLELLNRPR